MKQLIGETAMQALEQFFIQAQQHHEQHQRESLNKQLINPPNERL